MGFDDGPPEVEPGDPPVVKGLRRRPRWTIGRATTGLAIVLVAVPIGLNVLEPPVRGPGNCGNTTDNLVLGLGLFLLAVRPSWLLLQTMNDLGEWGLAALTGRDDFAGASSPRSPRKPKPLDDH